MIKPVQGTLHAAASVHVLMMCSWQAWFAHMHASCPANSAAALFGTEQQLLQQTCTVVSSLNKQANACCAPQTQAAEPHPFRLPCAASCKCNIITTFEPD
jgi:S-methylmethionine-dependent homocysteine/selenocysteine methylase